MSETYDPSYPGQQTLRDMWRRVITPDPSLPLGGAQPAPVGAPPGAAPAGGMQGLTPAMGPGINRALAQQFPPGGAQPGYTGPKNAAQLPGGQAPLPGPGGPPGGAMPGVKGDPWASPSAPAPGAQQGGPGAALGGAASGPSGPMTWQSVLKSIYEANPELKKRKDGPAIAAHAAAMYMPLMQHQSQEELKYIQQRLNMELGYGKLELGEAKVRLAEEKLARSREQYGKPKATDVEKNYESAFRAQQNAAKALAERPGDKNLKGMYEKATVNVDRLARMRDQIYGDVAKGQGSKFQEQLAGFAKQGGAWSPETHSQLLKSIPQELMASMRPEEQQQLTKILLANPDRADEILAWLKKKGTHETTIGKSDGGYYR